MRVNVNATHNISTLLNNVGPPKSYCGMVGVQSEFESPCIAFLTSTFKF